MRLAATEVLILVFGLSFYFAAVADVAVTADAEMAAAVSAEIAVYGSSSYFAAAAAASAATAVDAADAANH